MVTRFNHDGRWTNCHRQSGAVVWTSIFGWTYNAAWEDSGGVKRCPTDLWGGHATQSTGNPAGAYIIIVNNGLEINKIPVCT